MKRIAIALDGEFVTGESSPKPAVPIVWSVAGSDSGAGAGLAADLRAIGAFGLHGCTVVAAITAQNSVGVQRVEAVSSAMLEEQLSALAGDMPPAAIKTGTAGQRRELAEAGGTH